MSDLSETDTESYVRDRDSFSSTGTGIEEPADAEGLHRPLQRKNVERN